MIELIRYDENGLLVPTFEEIKNYLKNGAREIYGNDIQIEDGTADGIRINNYAEMLADACNSLQVVYNGFNKDYAIGRRLDGLAGLFGIARRPATKSTAQVKLTGIKGTIIRNGIVRDTSNISWLLPDYVVLDPDRAVTATCEFDGDIFADKNTITTIVTQVAGWTGVTNPNPSSIGKDVETDAQLRLRINESFSLNALTIIESLKTSIEHVNNVNSAVVYENDTSASRPIVPGSGTQLTAHTIACVVDGGDSQEIAYQIWKYKTPGIQLQGDVPVEIETDTGTKTINYYQASPKEVYVKLTINELSNFIESDKDRIKENIINTIKSYTIGKTIYATNIISNLIKEPTFNSFDVLSLTIGAGSTSGATANSLELKFNEVPNCEPVNIEFVE